MDDALASPFEDASFGRLFTGHFYGHLDPGERERFLAEARRVADEVVVVDSALREGVRPEETQERVLSDGSSHEVYKRYFDAEALAEELGGGRTLFCGTWFVVVAARLAGADAGTLWTSRATQRLRHGLRVAVGKMPVPPPRQRCLLVFVWQKQPGVMLLLSPEGFDRFEAGGAVGGEDAEDHSDQGRHPEGEGYLFGRHHRRGEVRQYPGQQHRARDA